MLVDVCPALFIPLPLPLLLSVWCASDSVVSGGEALTVGLEQGEAVQGLGSGSELKRTQKAQ